MIKILFITIVSILILITGCSSAIVTQTQTSTETHFLLQNKTETNTVTQSQTETLIQSVTQSQTETITQTVTQTVADNKNPIVSFAGVGFMDTPIFIVRSPKWIIQYSAKSMCTLTFSLEPHIINPMVKNKTMGNGTVYQIEMEGYTNYALFFTVHTSPFYLDIEWNISVIEVWE
ncbi:hypothetical protein ACFLYB_07240 [Chloroflexota bacterium]